VADDGEIAAIFTRLRDEVRSRAEVPELEPPAGDGQRAARGSLPARARAERAWAVTAEVPFQHRPGRGGRARGVALAPLKRVLRKLMRWYVEPLAGHQRTFNLAILTLVDELTERTDADVARLERRVETLERRLERERPDQVE
jgi:hypothetical protein